MDEIAEAPAWLVEIIRSARRNHKVTSAAALVELDQPEAIARAAHWLEHHAEVAVEGDGGDIATYRVACAVGDFGLSESATVDAMLDHWNERCSPPWDPAELAEKVQNAFAYRTAPIGRSSAAADFEPVEIEGPERERPKGLYFVPFAEAADQALDRMGDPLVEGYIDQQSMVVIYGPSGKGKTFVVLDIAFHIAAGRPWLGREVSKGLVVYVAAEGGMGIFRRLRALRQHYGEQDCALAMVPCPVNLLSDKADVKQLVALVRQAEQHYGQPVKMLVIDTLSRALAGGDENSSVDMGAFVKNVDKVRDAVKATLAIVHHTGKDVAKGARGWSGLQAATDTEIEIAPGLITNTKQRDRELQAEIKFALDPVAIGEDDKGRPVVSAVIRVLTGSEFMQVPLTGEEQAMQDAFIDAAKDKVLHAGRPLSAWEYEPVTVAEWEKEYLNSRKDYKSYVLDSKGKPAEGPHADFKAPSMRHLRRLRQACIESGVPVKIQQDQYVARVRTCGHSADMSAEDRSGHADSPL